MYKSISVQVIYIMHTNHQLKCHALKTLCGKDTLQETKDVCKIYTNTLMKANADANTDITTDFHVAIAIF